MTTTHSTTTHTDDVHFDVPQLRTVAEHHDDLAAVCGSRPSLADLAAMHREQAAVIRRAITAHEALADRFLAQTTELRGLKAVVAQNADAASVA